MTSERADFTLEMSYALEADDVFRSASIHGGPEGVPVWSPWFLEFDATRNAADRLALKGRLEAPAAYVEGRIWKTLRPRFWGLAPRLAAEVSRSLVSIPDAPADGLDQLRITLALMATTDERKGTIETHQLRLSVGLGDDLDPISILTAIPDTDPVTHERITPVRLGLEAIASEPRLTPDLEQLRTTLAVRFSHDFATFLDGIALS